ncbi:MAG: twin-arginine translocase subunit TatB [Hyphomicrobiaceae bacterium]|nr:MAG: twin-arginine translocase subunit TatB [Hyphomicrobiaceae bacterium]
MFDITSSKLLILGIVALLVIGPKDLPALLRTLGKYMGMIRRQANEFRAQFEEAMRETEMEQLKKEVESIGQEAEASMRAAEDSVRSDLDTARSSVDAAMESATSPADPFAHDANGLPVADAGSTANAAPALNGSTHPSEQPAAAPETPAAPGHATEKSGA